MSNLEINLDDNCNHDWVVYQTGYKVAEFYSICTKCGSIKEDKDEKRK